ncbi:MAG: tRNA (adenosine(37)-N6)-threonylcarbamoyltransferase complex ATPase subunit type 1 TsaE, partial [Patescibacteria group bacterium]
MKKEVRQSNSRQETFKIARDLLDNLGDHRIILLKGELGSGKTTFAQGLAKTLGIKKRVTSPSFLLIKIYSLPLNCGYGAPQFSHLYHLDLYRLKKIK